MAAGLLVAVLATASPAYRVSVPDPAAWTPLLSAVGLEAVAGDAPVRVLVGAVPAEGFVATGDAVRVAALIDERDPDLPIFWQEPETLPVYRVPPEARVFTREKHTGAPLVAGRDGLLWLARPPGESGYERFPYLLQALVDVGARPPFRDDRIWAFFDHAYRMRADPGYLARRWREAGIAALHVGAWPFHESDPTRDAHLERLIEAAHREAILVYAWLELPHVSDRFWADNSACREQTAAGQDAQLDWRKLVNLADPDCFDRAAAGVDALLGRFDWDGVNLAELYFESLHGPANPARFTPLNDWVRADAREKLGFDPLRLFEPGPTAWDRDPTSWRRFADYRADLALDLQKRWLERIRRAAPQADLVVTQIEDRFDDRMRDYLGADTAALLSLSEELGFTLLIEDPATLWSDGPERYPKIAARYLPEAPDPRRVAIDINIVERYQHAYPTRRQVGGELARLVALAGGAFERVALYFEASIGKPDLPLLPAAAAQARVVETGPDGITVEGRRPFGVAFRGPARVDGALWPVSDGETVWLPRGRRRIEPAETEPPARVLRFNGEILATRAGKESIAVEYRSSARALCLLDRKPATVAIDGQAIAAKIFGGAGRWTVRLPPGEHTADLGF